MLESRNTEEDGLDEEAKTDAEEEGAGGGARLEGCRGPLGRLRAGYMDVSMVSVQSAGVNVVRAGDGKARPSKSVLWMLTSTSLWVEFKGPHPPKLARRSGFGLSSRGKTSSTK